MKLPTFCRSLFLALLRLRLLIWYFPSRLSISGLGPKPKVTLDYRTGLGSTRIATYSSFFPQWKSMSRRLKVTRLLFDAPGCHVRWSAVFDFQKTFGRLVRHTVVFRQTILGMFTFSGGPDSPVASICAARIEFLPVGHQLLKIAINMAQLGRVIPGALLTHRKCLLQFSKDLIVSFH